MNLKRLGTLALASVMTFSLIGCTKKGPEGVAAKVNDVEIPMEDFYRNYAMRRDQVIMMAGGDKEALNQKGRDGQGTTNEIIKKQTLEDLIDSEVVKQAAKKEGIEVPKT
ncbi:MAG: SurA N-terminal domain-containing protein, partial [Tissierellia bacterium]|nr:SurA N-terminal domain-containing protein [Tissierellia bacterium]